MKHPERELLLCCARTKMDEAIGLRIRSIITQGIDWDCVLRLATPHRMMPFLYLNLRALSPDAVPHDIMNRLQSLHDANAQHNLTQMSILVRLLDILKLKGIPAIPIKGPIFAECIHGDLGLRQSTDLDVFIHGCDLHEVSELLAANNIYPRVQLTDTQEIVLVRFRGERVFSSTSNVLHLDIHWKLLPSHFSFDHGSEGVWEHSRTLNWEGWRPETLSRDDLLLYTCMKAGVDCWQSLYTIRDIAEVIRANQPVNWGMIIARAAKAGKRRILFIGLVLARDLLEADIPEEVMQQARAYPGVQSLAGKVQKRFLWRSTGAAGLVDMVFLHFQILERFRDRLDLCLQLPLSPGPNDIRLLRLPERLFPLYRVVRLVRASLKFLQYLWQSSRSRRSSR